MRTSVGVGGRSRSALDFSEVREVGDARFGESDFTLCAGSVLTVEIGIGSTDAAGDDNVMETLAHSVGERLLLS